MNEVKPSESRGTSSTTRMLSKLFMYFCQSIVVDSKHHKKEVQIDAVDCSISQKKVQISFVRYPNHRS